jgi:hypothetical protein
MPRLRAARVFATRQGNLIGTYFAHGEPALSAASSVLYP